MANNPLQKLQDAVVGTVKGAVRHPVGTAGKAVSQAKETVAVGRTVAEQVVGGVVGGVAGGVAARVGRVARAGSHVVPGGPQQPDAETATGTSDPGTEAVPAPTPITDAPTRKAAAKKAPAKKAPVKKAGARPRVTKPPVTDVVSKSVAEQAKHQPVKAAPTGPENPIDAAADPRLVDATPADVAKKTAAKKAPGTKSAAAKAPAKKASAKRSPANKATATAVETPEGSTPTESTPASTTPAKKGTTKKAAARKSSPRKAATPSGYLPVEGSAAGKEPLSAEELAGGAGPETITPVGTRGADVAHNPDTTSEDLQQPGTPPLMDAGTVHAVAAEAEMLSRAADPDKG